MLITFQQQFIVHPMDYEVFVGMDVDKPIIVVTSVDDLGTERSTRLPTMRVTACICEAFLRRTAAHFI